MRFVVASSCLWALALARYARGRDWHGNDRNRSFIWNDIPSLTTCQSTRVTWMLATHTRADDNRKMTISITQPRPETTSTFPQRVYATTAMRGTPCDRSFLANASRLITPTPIHPAELGFVWQSVNVSEGWYVLLAQFTGTDRRRDGLHHSSAFFVANGTDLSCLTEARTAIVLPSRTTSPSTTSTRSSSRARPSSSSTIKSFSSLDNGLSSPAEAAAATEAISPDTATASANAPASPDKSHVGLVVGSIVGGLAAVAWAIALGFLIRNLRRRRQTRNWVVLGDPPGEKSPSFGAYPADMTRPFSDLVPIRSQSVASYTTYTASEASHVASRYNSSYATAPSPAYPSGASLELQLGDSEDIIVAPQVHEYNYNAVDPTLGSQRSLSPLIGQAI
ncbi:hypothetical protein MKEN_00580800 [Mycena kentingensis (nom. inval.)]|nr:hypothetical protein MKEN_00580800 [Mycena kentingensis (nom. inval.)]